MKYCVPTKLDSQEGVSLVELLVVIVIISIVASIALMQRGSANEQFRRQAVSRDLKSAFERARFDSVKRRASTIGTYSRVTVTANSFTLQTDVSDSNSDCTIDSSNSVTTSLPAGVVIDNAATVTFNQRGEASSSGSLTFRVCMGACATLPSNENSDLLIVTPTGTVNLLGGAQTPVPFGSAANVADTSGSVTTNRNLVLGYAADTCVAPTPTPGP